MQGNRNDFAPVVRITHPGRIPPKIHHRALQNWLGCLW